MANEAQRKQALADIRENIARSGLHIYLVSDGQLHVLPTRLGLANRLVPN